MKGDIPKNVIVPNEKLEQFLQQQGIAWKVIPVGRHVGLESEWQTIYGKTGNLGGQRRRGHKALSEYQRESAVNFIIVPFLHGGPYTQKSKTRTTAYECHGNGMLPILSSFCAVELFISPPDMSWTMIHTHEDHGYGGPDFVRRD